MNSLLLEKPRPPRKIVIREDLVAATGHPIKAAVLGQMIYWSKHVKTGEAFLQEENLRGANHETSLQYGWFYKSSFQLQEELLGLASEKTIRNYLREFVSKGFLNARENPWSAWDRTLQYRVDSIAIDRAIDEQWTPISLVKLTQAKRVVSEEDRKKNLEKLLGKNSPLDSVNLPNGKTRIKTTELNQPKDQIHLVNLPNGLRPFTESPKINNKEENKEELIQKEKIHKKEKSSSDDSVSVSHQFSDSPFPSNQGPNFDKQDQNTLLQSSGMGLSDDYLPESHQDNQMGIETQEIDNPVVSNPITLPTDLEKEKDNFVAAPPPRAKKPKADWDMAGFEVFWSQYPRKVSKQEAISAWNKLKPSSELQDVILRALAFQKLQWHDPQYIKYPGGWLNGKKWEDELLPPEPPNNSPSGGMVQQKNTTFQSKEDQRREQNMKNILAARKERGLDNGKF